VEPRCVVGRRMAVLVNTRSAVGVMALLAASTAACGGTSSATQTAGMAASCVSPMLSVTPTTAHARDTVHVFGKWFAADCYDTGQAGQPPGLTHLRLVITQAGRAWTVASDITASGKDFTFDVPVRLPHALQPGTAQLKVVDYGAPARIQVSP